MSLSIWCPWTGHSGLSRSEEYLLKGAGSSLFVLMSLTGCIRKLSPAFQNKEGQGLEQFSCFRFFKHI